MARQLTRNEIKFLQPIFADTLPYGRVVCDINSSKVGGVDNSITPAGRPYFAASVYCDDFTATDWLSQWVFVHEMAHVWQWNHDKYPVLMAVGASLSNGFKYEKAYPYDLKANASLGDFNLEQQAAIVADYWSLTNKTPTRYNNAPKPSMTDYGSLMKELQGSGRPVRHSTMDDGWTRQQGF